MELTLQLVVVVLKGTHELMLKRSSMIIAQFHPPYNNYNTQGRRYETKSQSRIEEAMASSKKVQNPVCVLLFS